MRALKMVLPVLILLLATFTRFYQIDKQSLWHDEGNSLRLAERDVPALLDAVRPDIHPPGYYLLLKGWITGVGTSEFALRGLSAFWSLLAVAGTYALGRRLFGAEAGTAAALLIAINPFAVYYAQEARMYAQLSAVSVLSLWLLFEMLRKADAYLQRYGSPKPFATHIAPWAFALAAVNLLGLYTHYLYPFTMLAQGVLFFWWSLGRNDPRARTVYVASNLLCLMGFQPWLDTALEQIDRWPRTGDQTAWLDRLAQVSGIIIYGDSAISFNALWVVLPALIGAFSLTFWGRPKLFPSGLWRWSLIVAWIALNAGALLFSGAYRQTNLKFLLGAQLGMVLILGAGIAALFAAHFARPPVYMRVAGIALAALGLGFLLRENIQQLDRVYHDAAFRRADYRQMAEIIKQDPREGDAIILNAPNQQEVFSYYYTGVAPVFPLPPGLGDDDRETETLTRQVVENYRRIFLLLWGQQERDPNGVVKRVLDENAFVIARRWYGDVELIQYTVLAPPPETPTEITAMGFGDSIILEGFALSTAQIHSGDVLGVTLFWQTRQALPTRYKISVQLLYPSGFLATQHDSEPANGRLITPMWQPAETIIDNHGLVIQPDFPPGVYSLIVVVYDLNAPNNRLTVADGSPNQAFLLGTVEILP